MQSDSFRNAAVVAPNDGTNLPSSAISLFVGGAGNLVVDMENGATVTFTGVVAGTILPIRVVRVRSTLTTATNIVALS